MTTAGVTTNVLRVRGNAKIQDTVREFDNRLAHLEKQVSDTQTLLTSLKLEYEELKEQRKVLQNQAAPCSKLPAELFIHIIRYCLSSGYLGEYISYADLPITQIYRRWRHFLLSASSLWRFIAFNGCTPQLAELWFERSSGHTLEVTLNSSVDDPRFTGMMPVVSASSYFWEVARLSLTRGGLLALHPLRLNWSSLRRLDVRSNIVDQFTIGAFGCTSALDTLNCGIIPVGCPWPWSNLTRLIVEYTTIEILLQVLKRWCPELEQLIVFVQTTGSSTPVCHRNLRALTLGSAYDCRDLPAQLILPSLSDLSIMQWTMSGAEATMTSASSLYRMLLQSQCSLKSLTLACVSGLTTDDLTGIITLTPTLMELDVGGMPKDESAHCITNGFLETMTIRAYSSLATQLRTLRLWGDLHFDSEVLVEMVLSRLGTGSLDSNANLSLQHLAIWYYLDTDVHCARLLQELKESHGTDFSIRVVPAVERSSPPTWVAERVKRSKSVY